MKHFSSTHRMLGVFAALTLLFSTLPGQQPGAVQADSIPPGMEAVLENLPAGYTQQKVTASDGAAKDGFGYSVAISDDGSTALVGTYYIEFGIAYPIGPGSVYVFIKNGSTWAFQKKLPTPAMPDADLFGYSVALSANGSTALVGAQGGTGPVDTQVPGAAYVFTRSGSTWSQQAMLTASDRAVGDHFGISVALADNGSTALIGAYVDDVGVNANQGSAYVFTRSGSTWSQQTMLTAADGAANDYFGRSVGLSSDGNTAIIGANMKTIGANTRQGAAYIFTRSGSTWGQQARLTATDGGAYDWLGAAVGLSSDGNTALAGAEGHTVGANATQGAAYVFTRSGAAWTQQARLAALDGESSDMFGGAAALSPNGNTALLGAHWDMVNNIMTGSAYVFTRSGTTWAQDARLTAADSANGDNFGMSVALSGDGSSLLVGADLKKIGGNLSQGAAYFFTHTQDQIIPIYLPLIRR